MDLLLIFFRGVIFTSLVLFIYSCNSGDFPEYGKVIIEVNLESSPGISSEEQLGMNELDDLFQSGNIAWYFTPEREAVVHDFLLMGQNFIMRDIVNIGKNTQTILVDFLGEKIAISKSPEEFKRERGEVMQNFSYVLDRDRTKEILGCNCVAFEAYIDLGQQIVNHSGYLCEDLPMTASFVQGLDINPLPGAVFELDVKIGEVKIQYRAVKLEDKPEMSDIFEYDLNQYQLIPAEMLGHGSLFNPFN